MIAVIFEVVPAPGRIDLYLDTARDLRPLLDEVASLSGPLAAPMGVAGLSDRVRRRDALSIRVSMAISSVQTASVDAATHAAGGGWNIESRIFREESGGMKGEPGGDHGLDREILGARNMVQPEAVPDHDIGIDQPAV